MRVIKKLLKLIGILFLVIVLMMMSAVVLLCYAFYKASAVPEDYTGEIPTGGVIEATYLANGACDVSHQEVKTEDKAIKKYEIWYPSELVTENKKYPVVVVVNGTGVFATKAAPLFEHRDWESGSEYLERTEYRSDIKLAFSGKRKVRQPFLRESRP